MQNRSTYFLQAPVGNRSYVAWRSGRNGHAVALGGLEGWITNWLGSGTMGLAVAVLMAIARRAAKNPKVLIPAYGCPDLVSAIRFAGAEPLYIDMLESESRMDLQFARRIAQSREDVVAVIGVDLFGIPEDWRGLRAFADEFGLFLIQDLAQSVQERELMCEHLRGDAVVFSFGRGKPVCCLAGGALLTKAEVGDTSRPLLADLFQQYGKASPRFIRTKAVLYNFLLQPHIYAQFAKLMGNRLGETRYVPLKTLTFLPNSTARILDAAVASYWSEHTDVSDKLITSTERVTSASSSAPVALINNFSDLSKNRRLSRLPLLVKDAKLRGRLLDSFKRNGISSTTMYSRTLPQIVAEFDRSDHFEPMPNAEALSEALVTLPLHSRLRDRDIERFSTILADASEKHI